MLTRVKSVTVVKPAWGPKPEARLGHQACLINSGKPKTYLVIFSGINQSRQTLSDITLYDVFNNIWIPLVQSGSVPLNEERQLGRYRATMCYEKPQNQLLVFGGSSTKGLLCRPNLHVF